MRNPITPNVMKIYAVRRPYKTKDNKHTASEIKKHKIFKNIIF
jgi:hypothetical protein